MMLKVIATLSFTLAVVTAMSDPRAAFCWGKCPQHDAMEARCIDEAGCYPWDDETTIPCLEPCWEVSAPCRIGCFKFFDDCSEECAKASDDDRCYLDCLDKDFVEPPLPEQ